MCSSYRVQESIYPSQLRENWVIEGMGQKTSVDQMENIDWGKWVWLSSFVPQEESSLKSAILTPGPSLKYLDESKQSFNLNSVILSSLTCCSVTKSCPALCDPMDCSLPASSVHGILQERILEWVAIPCSRDLPNPGIEPKSPALQADFFFF